MAFSIERSSYVMLMLLNLVNIAIAFDTNQDNSGRNAALKEGFRCRSCDDSHRGCRPEHQTTEYCEKSISSCMIELFFNPYTNDAFNFRSGCGRSSNCPQNYTNLMCSAFVHGKQTCRLCCFDVNCHDPSPGSPMRMKIMRRLWGEMGQEDSAIQALLDEANRFALMPGSSEVTSTEGVNENASTAATNALDIQSRILGESSTDSKQQPIIPNIPESPLSINKRNSNESRTLDNMESKRIERMNSRLETINEPMSVEERMIRFQEVAETRRDAIHENKLESRSAQVDETQQNTMEGNISPEVPSSRQQSKQANHGRDNLSETKAPFSQSEEEIILELRKKASNELTETGIHSTTLNETSATRGDEKGLPSSAKSNFAIQKLNKFNQQKTKSENDVEEILLKTTQSVEADEGRRRRLKPSVQLDAEKPYAASRMDVREDEEVNPSHTKQDASEISPATGDEKSLPFSAKSNSVAQLLNEVNQQGAKPEEDIEKILIKTTQSSEADEELSKRLNAKVQLGVEKSYAASRSDAQEDENVDLSHTGQDVNGMSSAKGRKDKTFDNIRPAKKLHVVARSRESSTNGGNFRKTSKTVIIVLHLVLEFLLSHGR